MTLADHACGGTAASTVPEERDVIIVENKVSFLRPASGPDLICRAEVLRAGGNLVFVEAEVEGEGGAQWSPRHPLRLLFALRSQHREQVKNF
jgi:acyl-coenzyme A thioesterase PaaI-like protein